MTFLLFVVTFAAVLALLVGIIWWRSVLSFEGVGLLLMLPAVVTDVFGVTLELFQNPGPIVERTMEDRIFPNVVCVVGLIALAAGLAAVDRYPPPIGRKLCD